MDSQARPPRKARKSMRSQGNAIVAPNITESVSNAASSSVSSTVRKSARKSIGTPSMTANINQATRPVQSTTRSSVGISQDTTLPLPKQSCSRDDNSSDSDTELQRTRSSVANSLNSTVPFSKPGCSRDPDSSDSDFSPTVTKKISRQKAAMPASKTTKKPPVNMSSSSPSSTSEESEVEEMLKKQAAKKFKAEAKANKSSPKQTGNAGNSLINPSNLADQCVFYILVANRSKKAIKKRDIIQHVFEGRNTHLFPEILKKAASRLQKTFGFELMELKSSKNEYLLVNNLWHQYEVVQEFAEYSLMDRQKQGFIFYILTLIFMNENSIMEDELWKALDPLGIEIKSRKPHPIFGDVQKFVTSTLVKQMYIERRQLSKDPPQYELSWGERAHKEVLKEDLLDFVCKIMPDTKPEEWILQYKDAKGGFTEGDAEMEVE